MSRRQSKKKSTQEGSTRDPLDEFIKLGKTNAQAERYPEAIAAYEAAMDLVRRRPDKVRKRYERLWPTLAELYVRIGQINRGRVLYQDYLVFLLGSGRIGKFRNTIRASRDVAGTDLQVDLVSIFRETKKYSIMHQLSRPILDNLFNQAIEAYESDPDPFTFTLISELLPRVHIELPFTQDSLEAHVTQPDGLMQVLQGMRDDTPSPIPAPAALPVIDEDERRQNLHAIWAKRVHGTYMYRGAGYGVRTAMSFLLDMLDDAHGIAKIEVEGIEDFDIYYIGQTTSFLPTALPPRAYVQAKSRDPGQPAWSVGQLRDVLNNFAEVHCEDPESNFLFVTDYHFGQQTTLSDVIDYPDLGAFDQDHSIRDDVLRLLKPDFITDERFDLDAFLKRIHFRVLDRDLESLLIERLSDLTGSPKSIAVRYYDALFEEVHKLAETAKVSRAKKAFSKPDLERFLYEVIASVDVSAIEGPLRRGNLELLTFSVTGETPPRPDPNYYLGVYADIRHILAGQDIRRPELMAELAIKLVQRNFCVLRSPSGTGKTTLMYRFAHDHRHSFTIYRLRRLDGDSETIEACIRYIKSLQPSEQSPILLLIDDISRPEKLGWQELLEPILENPNVYVIATTREDEWSDFLARGINVEYVHLTLSEDTARGFHRMLKEHEQLHPDYPDWREAYEVSKTNGLALFMEYAHILTQGKRIRDVLSEQVERIAGQPAPDSAIQMNLLRLICTAHAFGGRIPADLLTSLVDSRGEDLYRHLERLVNEHLVVREQEYYVGLHEVRSRFLYDLTHQYPPPSLRETLTRLLTYLPIRESAPIVEGVCRNLPEAAVEILGTLASRLNADGDIREIAEVIRRLYLASEWHYAREVRAYLDRFGVNPTEVNVFAVELAPVLPAPTGILDMDLFRAEAREAFATAPPRGSNRFEQQIGSKLDVAALAAKIDVEDHVAAIVYLLNWLPDIEPALVEEVVANVNISRLATFIINETSGQRAASLLFHVWRSNPTAYNQLVAALGGQQAMADRLLATYHLIAKIEWDEADDEQGNAVHLYFWADDPLDELGDEADVHDKALFLAGVARRMFPTAARVRTTGLFATGREYKLGMYDPATKDMPVENFVVLEDTERNRIWLRAIAARYTSKTWYAYLQQQDTLRVKYLTSLSLIAALVQASRSSPSRSASTVAQLPRLLATYQSLVLGESKMLPFPPDPESTFLDPKGDRDTYYDPDKALHEQLLQGLYHVTPHRVADGDHFFRNYTGAIDRCVQFLCEYTLSGDRRKLELLKLNAASVVHELSRFQDEREKLQLRQAEHADLLPVELRLVERVRKAAKYTFDRDYEDLWAEAEILLQKAHLLINRLAVLQSELVSQRRGPNMELARALSDELATMLPSVDVLVQLSAELQYSPTTLISHRISDYIRQLSNLMTLDCFVALAQKRQGDLKAIRLEEIEDGLRAEGVRIAFGSPILEEEAIGITWETLPIVFQVSDLMDIREKGPIIFRRVFAEEFSEWQRFTLVVTDGQAIVWPVVWMLNYLDRPKWDLAEQIDPSSFITLCLPRIDLVEQYSTHLGLPIAKEPEYVQAMQAFYSAVVEASMEIARLRHDIRLQRKDLEEAERFLESRSEGTDEAADDEEIHPLQTQVDFLIGFQPSPEFQGYHVDVLNFMVELGNQLKREVDTLKQAVADAEADAEIRAVPDMILDSLADSIEASSSSQTKAQVRARLSTPGPVAYEDMDIPSKFGAIYFFVKNYFHFGRTEY